MCYEVFALESDINHDVIQKWWKENSEEEISIEYDGYKSLHLSNNEKAYLANVYVYGRGRNFASQVILIRPKLKKVVILDSPITHEFEIFDLDNNGVSEIVGTSLGSGQGTTKGKKSIIQIDEWERITILREMDFTDNSGAYGKKDYRYFMKDVFWEFSDIDKDGKLDLRETRVIHEGRNNRNPIVTEGLYKYVFKNNEFIRYLKYKK
jgi:hypothetical protein